MMNLAIFTDDLSLGQAALVSLVCMLIVFGMLALLWGIVTLIGLIKPKQKKEDAQPEASTPVAPTTKSFKLEDIKDDDMMAAALVATIDYHNEIKKDVRVVSIKEL